MLEDLKFDVVFDFLHCVIVEIDILCLLLRLSGFPELSVLLEGIYAFFVIFILGFPLECLHQLVLLFPLQVAFQGTFGPSFGFLLLLCLQLDQQCGLIE